MLRFLLIFQFLVQAFQMVFYQVRESDTRSLLKVVSFGTLKILLAWIQKKVSFILSRYSQGLDNWRYWFFLDHLLATFIDSPRSLQQINSFSLLNCDYLACLMSYFCECPIFFAKEYLQVLAMKMTANNLKQLRHLYHHKYP